MLSPASCCACALLKRVYQNIRLFAGHIRLPLAETSYIGLTNSRPVAGTELALRPIEGEPEVSALEFDNLQAGGAVASIAEYRPHMGAAALDHSFVGACLHAIQSADRVQARSYGGHFVNFCKI